MINIVCTCAPVATKSIYFSSIITNASDVFQLCGHFVRGGFDCEQWAKQNNQRAGCCDKDHCCDNPIRPNQVQWVFSFFLFSSSSSARWFGFLLLFVSRLHFLWDFRLLFRRSIDCVHIQEANKFMPFWLSRMRVLMCTMSALCWSKSVSVWSGSINHTHPTKSIRRLSFTLFTSSVSGCQTRAHTHTCGAQTRETTLENERRAIVINFSLVKFEIQDLATLTTASHRICSH